MEKVLIRYEGNGSSRYNRKEYFEAASKLKREKSRGPLKNGEQVIIKTKNCVWRAVVVNVKPSLTIDLLVRVTQDSPVWTVSHGPRALSVCCHPQTTVDTL